jgi:beta-glucosidase/6-phospho-beta-glucosidase/beta-galactosidase
VVSEFPDFAVACGEEASDPLVSHDGAVVRVDQLTASDHLAHQDDDLASVAGLGVRWWRYGMPWRWTEPEPGTFDWSWWDRAFAAAERHGLEPIVDLCHFGLPDHYPGFCDPSWVDGFVRYVDSFLDRYPEPRFFTPVNEPSITAQCSGRWGLWNDRRASAEDHLAALGHVTLANLEAIARIDADRAGWWIGAEGFGCHLAVDDDSVDAAEDARALEQLVWDLHFGVTPPDRAADALDLIDARILDRISALAVTSHRVVAGHDFYPVSVHVHGDPSRELTIDERVAAYDTEARRWHERYSRAFWVAETSNLGLRVDEGVAWLTTLLSALDRMRTDGLPVRGICWYSRGDQYDWHTMLARPVGEVTRVGLFDDRRHARPVADEYAALARSTPHGAAQRGDRG